MHLYLTTAAGAYVILLVSFPYTHHRAHPVLALHINDLHKRPFDQLLKVAVRVVQVLFYLCTGQLDRLDILECGWLLLLLCLEVC